MENRDEWARFYEDDNIIMPELGMYDDEPLDAANNMAESPKISPSSNRGGLFPKSSLGKPMRRRSRASRKAPTTLLNANANNFRALVQQFTGCHSSNPTNYKGPINLNFAQYSYSEEPRQPINGRLGQDCRNHQEVDPSFFGINGTSNNNNNNNINNNNIFVANTTMSTTTTTTSTSDGQELFVSSVNYDQLTLDDFEMGSLSLQDVSGPAGDHYASALPATRNDGVFWGF